MKRLIVRPAAASDIEEASLWYERQRPGLGEEFLSALDAVIQQVKRNPQLFPLIHRDARRALLRRFPYAIYYKDDIETVVVVGCFHAKRHPRKWRSRA